MSLFSLQDIITCLTGIMILIVLILALEAITSPEAYASLPADPSVRTEELIRMRNAFELRLSHLQTEMHRLRLRLQAQDDPVSLIRSAQDAMKELSVLKSEIKQKNQERERVTEELKQRKEDQGLLSQRHAELTEQLAALQRRIQTGEFGRVRILPGANQRKTAHLLEVDGTNVKVLSLSEPRRDRSWSHAQNTVELSRLLDEANPIDEFFVVMIKPSGFTQGKEIFNRIESQGFEAGFDPLEEHMNVITGRSP